MAGDWRLALGCTTQPCYSQHDTVVFTHDQSLTGREMRALEWGISITVIHDSLDLVSYVSGDVWVLRHRKKKGESGPDHKQQTCCRTNSHQTAAWRLPVKLSCCMAEVKQEPKQASGFWMQTSLRQDMELFHCVAALATSPAAKLAELAGASPTACWHSSLTMLTVSLSGFCG